MPLTLVGTGLRPELHCTREALARLTSASCLLHPPQDPVGPWLRRVNPRAGPADPLAILARLEHGEDVTVAFHGHPAVFRRGSHDLLARARELGHDARMLVGVSLEDCLCAHLELDPLEGWQAYEASNFLLHARPWSPRRTLVLWRLSALWERDAIACPVRRRCLELLARHLQEVYGDQHPAALYHPQGSFVELRLDELAGAELVPDTALVVPSGSLRLPPGGEGRLTVVGAGLTSGQLTLQALDLLARAEEVFGLEPLPELEREVRSLTERDLQEALLHGRQVAVLVPGHPAMGGFARALCQAVRAHGCSAALLPGISPLGVLYAQLGFNPSDGCQVLPSPLPADRDPTAPGLLVTEQGRVLPVPPVRVAEPDPTMLTRLAAAAARENTDFLLESLPEGDRTAWEALVFERLRTLADDLGLPSVKRLPAATQELIRLKAAMDFSLDLLVTRCAQLGVDATSPGALLEHAGANPDSELARLAWLNACSRQAWEALG